MARTMAAWVAPEQIGLVQAAAKAAQVSIVAAGSPVKGQTGSAAERLGGRPTDDLRAMLATVDASLILIAAPALFGSSASTDDSAAVRSAHARGVRIVAMEPIPAAAMDLTGGGWTETGEGARAVDVVRFAPLARDSASFRGAADVLAQFGHVRSVLVECWCSAAEGSLGARVYDGMHLIHSLLGEPETVDASYAEPGQGKGLHALPGESLRGLAGDLTANLRFGDGRAAALAASDRAGRWGRMATLIGPAGRLWIGDAGFGWIDPDGRIVDESTFAGADSAAALGDRLARILDAPDTGPVDHGTILAMGQAALLSARTAQAESPATIKHMAGAA